jgi:hypothetical protein
MLSVLVVYFTFWGLTVPITLVHIQAEKRRRARSDNNIDFTAQQQILTMVIINTN